jgi:hypothetical protein
MERLKREALAEQRRKVEREIAWAGELLRVLEREEFETTHIRNFSGPCWYIRVTPPKRLQEGFGLAPEVLIVAVRGQVQARAIHEIEGISNPLTAWYTPLWLGPLQPLKAVELLRKLGRRVGLDVGRNTTALAAQWTGGHPLLHRQFGSAVRRLVREHDLSWKAKTDEFLEHAPARFEEREAVVEVMREIVALLGKRYPGTLEVLERMAMGAPWATALAKRGGPNGDAGRVLQNFGLVSPEGRCAEALMSYLRRTRASSSPPLVVTGP